MTHVTAVLSMLHESEDRNSATRRFRGAPVLAWTLRRLARAERVGSMVVLCWEDQLAHVESIAGEGGANLLVKGPRAPVPALDAITAARRWADGWRGGLLASCDFDLGFHAPWHAEILQRENADAAVLVDPASALIDPVLVDGVIAHAAAHDAVELSFSQAAPGLSGVVVRPSLLTRLAAARAHPGRLLHYLPAQPTRDPIAGDGCAPVPTPVARTVHRFKLDSDRQIQRIGLATMPLNGSLMTSEADELVRRLSASPMQDRLPREIVLELNTTRATRPIYWPGRHLPIDRAPMTLDTARRVFDECAAGADDLRLTLAGVGDALLAPDVFEIIEAAAEAGISAIHIETDLLAPPDQVRKLASAPVDIVSVHLPALSAQTYAAVMGVDAYAVALDNLRTFVLERQQRGRGVPIVVPVFTKCAANLAEMEPWYDQWLGALGSAVIAGPTTCGGQIPDVGVADMSPPRRRPCARLSSRMTILSDGRIVSCEQDVTGRQVIGLVGATTIERVWRERFPLIREQHRAGDVTTLPVCNTCSEWHRP
jgi:hypothetical protein